MENCGLLVFVGPVGSTERHSCLFQVQGGDFIYQLDSCVSSKKQLSVQSEKKISSQLQIKLNIHILSIQHKI